LLIIEYFTLDNQQMPANLRGWVGKKKRMNKKTCLAKQGQHYETTVGEADHKF
jgi:hypothetical protein